MVTEGIEIFAEEKPVEQIEKEDMLGFLAMARQQIASSINNISTLGPVMKAKLNSKTDAEWLAEFPTHGAQIVEVKKFINDSKKGNILFSLNAEFYKALVIQKEATPE